MLLLFGACRPTPPGSERRAAAETSARAPASAVSETATPDASADVDAGEAGTVRLEPLTAKQPLVELEVPKFRPATVSLPLGATEKRPVVVALHGNYDRPEWQCEVMREITRGFPFILCPRGIPRSDAPKSEDRWEYGGLDKTDSELSAALDALQSRYSDWVDGEHVVYTGFSLGAILGKSIVTARAGTFSRAVFSEGGFEGWSAARAKKFAEAGVGRVVFACGQAACVQSSKAAQRLLEAQGIPTHVVSGGNAGHTYDGPVARAISREWAWLVEGDTRWAGAGLQ